MLYILQTLLTSGIFGNRNTSTYLEIWLAFALPFTFLSLALLRFLWVEPIYWDMAMEHLKATAVVNQVLAKLRYPRRPRMDNARDI